MNEINLSNVHGCLTELQTCANGLAFLDHKFHEATQAVSRNEALMESIEARAAEWARQDAPKAATAAEIKGRMTRYINERTEDAKVRAELRSAKDLLAKVERYMRSLEKRIGAAQAARNGHELLAKAGGQG